MKQIPVLPWTLIPPLPLERLKLNLPILPDDRVVKLFEITAQQDHDILGLISIEKPDTGTFTPMDALNSRFGVGVHVRTVEKTDVNTALIDLSGLCRFEVINMARNNEDHLVFDIRWFEDEVEPDEILQPLYKANLRLVERIARIGGEKLKLYFNASEQLKYSRMSAQYGSFFLMHEKFSSWFTFEERFSLLKITSTAERLRRVNERVEEMLPAMQRKFAAERRARNN